MGKLMCHHCRRSFELLGVNKDEVEETMGMTELDGRHYCKTCKDMFCSYLIDDGTVVARALAFGMEFKQTFWQKLWK